MGPLNSEVPIFLVFGAFLVADNNFIIYFIISVVGDTQESERYFAREQVFLRLLPQVSHDIVFCRMTTSSNSIPKKITGFPLQISWWPVLTRRGEEGRGRPMRKAATLSEQPEMWRWWTIQSTRIITQKNTLTSTGM